MKKTVVLYKTKNPVYFNKGTVHETTCDEFLAYYTYRTPEEVEHEVEILNNTHPKILWNGEKIDWNTVDYFFIQKQREFE